MGVRLYSMEEQYLHVIDVTDPDLLMHEAAQLGNEDPILLRRGLPDAVEMMVQRILDTVRRGGRPIGTLTFHGHGLPGIQSLAGGIPTVESPVETEWVLARIAPHARDVLSNRNLDSIRPALGRLRGRFSRRGKVRLMGCYVGRGLEGRRLLRSLAGIWQVPVVAGVDRQAAGDLATYSFEGPVVAEFP